MTTLLRNTESPIITFVCFFWWSERERLTDNDRIASGMIRKATGIMILLPSHSPEKDHAMGAARWEPRGGLMPMELVSNQPSDDFPAEQSALSSRSVGDKYGLILKAGNDVWRQEHSLIHKIHERGWENEEGLGLSARWSLSGRFIPSDRFRSGRGSSGARDTEQHRKLLCSYIDCSDDHNEKETPPADPLSDREAPYPALSLHSTFGTTQDDR